ncbi:MAG: DUF4338 domain-containing protein [Thiohalocapsa sp. PB-PSB1]|jgi:hypothetical protein|nr:MAG: hypothetical protein N838_26045 [Thiohalocapsa sp. PB-PSB1]QQO55496.1 MAG: DUF4338 domain-containing protein [Thiohalocapsa sp. PB-PSB1]
MSHRCCGRDFDAGDIALIRRLIAEDPQRTRAELSRLTCRALHWRKPDGGLKDMSARAAILRMHDDGLIALPPPRGKRPDPRVRISARSDPGEPLDMPAGALPAPVFQRVRTRDESRLWNEYIQRCHDLGHKPLPGAQLRYTVYSAGQPIALLGFGAAAWMSAPRDHSIGWSHAQRRRQLHLVVNNARFLILPWIHAHNLASMLLAKAAKLLPEHWQDAYAYRPVLLETFVEKPRFRGTCCHAANWVRLGTTKGRGKLGPTGKPSVPIRDLWVYPLDRHFRALLTR